jgi:hypothetical protein
LRFDFFWYFFLYVDILPSAAGSSNKPAKIKEKTDGLFPELKGRRMATQAQNEKVQKTGSVGAIQGLEKCIRFFQNELQSIPKRNYEAIQEMIKTDLNDPTIPREALKERLEAIANSENQRDQLQNLISKCIDLKKVIISMDSK